MEKALITGGGGFIGANLVKRLLADGYHIRVLDNGFRGGTARLEMLMREVEFISGDVRDADTVGRAFKGIDLVFHLASVNGTKYFYEIPETVLEVSTKGVFNCIDAAIRHGVSRFILASSSEVYHEPSAIPTPESHPVVIPDIKNPRFSYSGGKIISELLILHYGARGYFQPLIFRPYNIYGPDMGFNHVIPEFIQRILANQSNGAAKIVIQGTGQETRAFCHIQDLIDGLMTILQNSKPGEIYNIGNDKEEITIGQLAQEIALKLSIEIDLIPTPLQPGSCLRRCPDITKLRALGFEPHIPLTEGLESTIDWYLPVFNKGKRHI
jgi:nucleoside-diphosphate-sugar epimerase